MHDRLNCPQHPVPRRILFAALCLLLAGCDGPQSALGPASEGAQQMADLFGWMLTFAAVIWLAVMATAIYAMRVRPEPHREPRVKLLLGGVGMVLPTILLTVLLIYGLRAMPGLLAPGDGLRIEVEGLQWWWRVRYVLPDGRSFESANEIRLPLGRRTEFSLTSADVIHAFWVPSLGGKVDMIPGRVNRLALEPTRAGTFRGACAEFCGGPHAWMAFPVVVSEDGAFSDWVDAQLEAAEEPRGGALQRGYGLFIDNGCGACHTVRGSPADGRVGPDLTHVASRLTIGAGVLPAEADAFARWVGETDHVKPGVLMPTYSMLSQRELSDLAAYLASLR